MKTDVANELTEAVRCLIRVQGDGWMTNGEGKEVPFTSWGEIRYSRAPTAEQAEVADLVWKAIVALRKARQLAGGKWAD